MTTSNPSTPVVAANVPEVRSFKVKFTYNFFTPDEGVNENGSVPNSISSRRSVNFDSVFIDKVERTIPRVVTFDFTKIELSGRSLNDRATPVGRISNNIEKIYTEQEFSNQYYTNIDFQDTGLDGKMFLLMSGTMAKKLVAENVDVANQINQGIEDVGLLVDSQQTTLLEVSKFLDGRTGDSITNRTVLQALNRIEALGAGFLDNDQIQEKIDDAYAELKNVKIRTRINNKFIKSSLMSAINDSLGIYADELRPLIPILKTIESETIGRDSVSSMDAAEFDVTVEPISQEIAPPSTFLRPNRKIAGYIIDKFVMLSDGTLEPRDPIIIESATATRSVDFNIKYGETYFYQIRAIAEVSFQTYDSNNDDPIISTILVSSLPSSRVSIDCVENVPPRPPVDFDIGWDRSEKATRLIWSFPTNPQRDIKKFQVFRRENVESSFELIKQFDFDDSHLKIEDGESPNLNVVEEVDSPVGIYLDKEFKKDSRFIYALCSLDAHGLSSNYSMQFEVWFDKFTNTVKKKLLSNSGAPKSYPNMYLRADAFEDVIRDSGHSKMQIFFDPEYLSVSNRTGNRDLGLLATDLTKGEYKLSLVNVDLQKSTRVDIILNDKRSTDERTKSPNYFPINKLRGK